MNQELVVKIAQILKPWAWETKSWNATLARDDAMAKAGQIVESLNVPDRVEVIRGVTDEMRRFMPNACGDWADKIDAALATSPRASGDRLREAGIAYVIAEARRTLAAVQRTLECNADDERRWSETIQWLEGLA